MIIMTILYISAIIKPMNKESTKGFFALLGSGLILGSFGIFVRSLSHDLTGYQQIVFRNFFALAFALAIYFFIKNGATLRINQKKYVLLYGIFFPLSALFYTLSILQTKIALTILSLYIGSIIGSFFIGISFFGEKVNRKKIISIVLVIAGLAFISFPITKNSINLGVLFGFLAGAFESMGNAFRKHLGDKVDRFFLVAVAMLGGVLISTGMILFSNQSLVFLHQISAFNWFVGLFFAVLIVIMQYLTIVGFQHFDLNLGTLVRSSEIIFGIIFAMLSFKEFPNGKEAVGGLLIVLAIILSHLNFKTSSKITSIA